MSKKLQELTIDDYKNILDNYYASKINRRNLSFEEINELSIHLNKKIRVPIIEETGEDKILIKIVLTIENFLYDNLPNEFYDLIHSTEKGFNDKEARLLIRRIMQAAIIQINMPYLPEFVEKFAVRFIVGLLVKASRKNYCLKGVLKYSDNIPIPQQEEEIDQKSDENFKDMQLAEDIAFHDYNF